MFSGIKNGTLVSRKELRKTKPKQLEHNFCQKKRWFQNLYWQFLLSATRFHHHLRGFLKTETAF